MMDDFVGSPQRRVLVFEDIETMRTGGYYFFYSVIVQHLNVLKCQHLENKFISRTLSQVACTTFFVTQHSKFNVEMIQNFYKRAGDFLCALVKTTGTSYPEKYFG